MSRRYFLWILLFVAYTASSMQVVNAAESGHEQDEQSWVSKNATVIATGVLVVVGAGLAYYYDLVPSFPTADAGLIYSDKEGIPEDSRDLIYKERPDYIRYYCHDEKESDLTSCTRYDKVTILQRNPENNFYWMQGDTCFHDTETNKFDHCDNKENINDDFISSWMARVTPDPRHWVPERKENLVKGNVVEDRTRLYCDKQDNGETQCRMYMKVHTLSPTAEETENNFKWLKFRSCNHNDAHDVVSCENDGGMNLADDDSFQGYWLYQVVGLNPADKKESWASFWHWLFGK